MESEPPIAIEVRFDSPTFRDLPENEKQALLDKLKGSGVVTEAHVNPKARDEQIEEEYYERWHRHLHWHGLHGGLGEQIYLFVLCTGAALTTATTGALASELIKRVFEWLDERYKRKGKVGLAEVTLYGPDGKQINDRAIVYDGRERKKRGPDQSEGTTAGSD